jgi:predicted glycogen debranching enzyme
MLLQKLEETIRIKDTDYHLSTNAYPGALYPHGIQYLEAFRLDPFPIFRYRLDDTVLEKEIIAIHGENTVVVQYRLMQSPEPIAFTADLLVNYRNLHSLTHENSSLKFATEMFERGVKISAAPDAIPYYVWSDKAKFRSTGNWYRNFVYTQEFERGYEYHEDLFSPGQLTNPLDAGDSFNIVASTFWTPNVDLVGLVSQQWDRVKAIARRTDDTFLRILFLACDAFPVRRGLGQSCIAGYHWFDDWGRDAMISLPGLTLVPGLPQEAKLILQTFAKYMRYGLIPNCFSEVGGVPQYNSLDATLWFFHAIRKYFQYTNDGSTIRALYPTLKESVQTLQRGTIFDVRADTDMLLNIGSNDAQLTWMDAKIGKHVVTPRNGKAVEINALWYCALDTMSGFADLIGNLNERDEFANLTEQVKTSFLASFWNPNQECLFDRVENGHPDASLRPNQIIAIALPRSILPCDRERRIVEAVEKELLTPFGLRTLSPNDNRYCGHYEGDQKSRDLAYHQGSVWPWLLGPFVKAYVRVAENTSSARETARTFIEPMRNHLAEAGVGFISELFDGDPPHRPKGCIAQAWSVAEILRAYYEDILGKEPEDKLARR